MNRIKFALVRFISIQCKNIPNFSRSFFGNGGMNVDSCCQKIIKYFNNFYKDISLITSPAIIMPATGGTKETLPGV